MTRHASRFQRWIPALHWSLWGLMVSTIVILVGTLLPFKFSIVDWSLQAAIDEFFFSTTTWEDRFNNVLLFMPYGFAGMAWLHWRRQQRRGRQPGQAQPTALLQRVTPWLITGLASTGLSCLVESLQTFLPSRSTSINDVVTNTLGGLVGAGLWWVAKRWLRSDARWWDWVKRGWRNPRVVAILLITWAGVMILLPIGLQKSAQIQGWDPSYPLAIGNEITGDRPWDGEVKALMISDRALSEAAVATLLTAKPVPTTAPPLSSNQTLNESANPSTNLSANPYANPAAHPLANPSPQPLENASSNELIVALPTLPNSIVNYRFEGRAPYVDRAGQGPALVWQGPDSARLAAQQGAVTHQGQWLLSTQPASQITTAIDRSKEFTVVVVAKTHTLDQTGPARIISLSQDTTHRNFTLGQGRDNITVRLRTPMMGKNADLISLTVAQAFIPHQLHRFVVTYRQGILSLYIDRPDQRHVLQLTPDISLVRYLFPSNGRSLRLTPKAMLAYQGFYYLFFCVPLGILVGQSLNITQMGRLSQGLLIAVGLALPTLGLTLLTSQNQGFAWQIWGICLALTIVALGAFLWIQINIAKRKIAFVKGLT